MTLFDINTDLFDTEPVYVRVIETHIGKAVVAERRYPGTAVIGEITGELSFISPGDNYTFEFDDELQLQPSEPFRYLNHSCNANCEFELCDQPATDEQPAHTGLFLISLREIDPGEELTIDYNWPAWCAIPCQCREPDCCGWVVAKEELPQLQQRLKTENSDSPDMSA